jgi:hypothetical protein
VGFDGELLITLVLGDDTVMHIPLHNICITLVLLTSFVPHWRAGDRETDIPPPGFRYTAARILLIFEIAPVLGICRAPESHNLFDCRLLI